MTAFFPNICVPVLAVDLHSPLVWAVVIGWMCSVVLHELAHGAVGHLGGDHTLRDRGGLSLNPLQYIDPLNTIILPLFFLLNGGVPLVGGVTYIREDLLRSRLWVSAVALAGPAMNLILFLLLMLPFHPQIGWFDVPKSVDDWTPFQLCLATLGWLQFVGAIINLIPLPPLDGFNAIKSFLPRDMRDLLTQPQARMFGFFILYFLLNRAPGVVQGIYDLEKYVLQILGFGSRVHLFGSAFNKVLHS